MADVVPIFHILNDIVHSKLNEHIVDLGNGGAAFDVTAENMNDMQYTVMQDDARQSVEECTGVTINPETYLKLLQKNIKQESDIGVPSLTMRARVDALYARDFFETYWDVVMRPEYVRQHNRRMVVQQHIIGTQSTWHKFQDRGLFSVSMQISRYIDDCWCEWDDACFKESYYQSAHDFEMSKVKTIFRVADEFMRDHQKFVMAGNNLGAHLRKMCDVRRKQKIKG